MHRMVATVFKVLGLSVVLFLVVDTIGLVVDQQAVEHRMTSLSDIVKDEVSRNNTIPDDMQGFFESELQDTIASSNVAISYESNFKNSLTVDGKTYDSLSEENVKDYGEVLDIVVVIKFAPSMLTYNNKQSGTDSMLSWRYFTYERVYKYQVPALRYLK